MSGTVFADVVVGIPLPNGGKRWQKVGVMMKMEQNDASKGPGFIILMDKTFNPAGVPGPETSVAISTYWPKEKEAKPPTATRLARPPGDFEDDIPF